MSLSAKMLADAPKSGAKSFAGGGPRFADTPFPRAA